MQQGVETGMTSDVVQISPAPPARTSMRYATLRESGLGHIRALAADSWTDHNVHDPGITILEALCYALTELAFRGQLDVADLLKSGEIHARPDLVPLHRVLPMAPVHESDLRKLLLDHYLVGDASVTADGDPEITLFENRPTPEAVLGDPPLVEAPVNGSPEVEIRGLREILLSFRDLDLNSNTYTASVTTADGTFVVDFALPHWDEEEAAPLLEKPTIGLVTMRNTGTGFWRKLEEAQTFFGQVQVDFTGSGGSGTTELWTVMQITDSSLDPPVIANILAAAQVVVEILGTGSLIARYVNNVGTAFASVQRVERYLHGWRNLCEDVVRLSAARVQEIAVRARIDVTGSTNLETLLARIFFAIDNAISPPVIFSSLAELRAEGRTAEEIFEGPLLRHGFLRELGDDSFADQIQLYVSDVLRLIMQLRNETGGDLVAQENPSGRDIVAVTDLTLSNFINNRPITRNAYDCLRLVEPGRYRPRLSIAKSQIEFFRDDVAVPYDLTRVAALFESLKVDQAATIAPDEHAPPWPAAEGDPLPVEDYYPFQNDLPRVYGVGEAGLPASAGTERRARARQTKGYLMLFEQILADVTSQLANINRFFSADPDEDTTYFTHPLYEITDVQSLLRSFPDGADWDTFMADEVNDYRVALAAAAEDEDRFLDRRNRMFDHLLARLGEEAVALGQELHRSARKQLTDTISDATLLEQKRPQRRRDVNRRLLAAKAAFLEDVPELGTSRLQAFGDPLQRRPEMLAVTQTGSGYKWVLSLGGDALLESTVTYGSVAAAAVSAGEAVLLAAQIAFYSAVPDGAQQRYELAGGPGGNPVGRSPQTFATVSAAQTAAAATALRFARLRMALSMTPMEQRVAHLTGIRSTLRRRLAVPVSDFFEIFDDPDADPMIEKRWRLWSEPGFSGDALLESATVFEAATDPAAVALAEEGVDLALRFAIDEWSYRVQPSASSFHVELADSNDTLLASRTTSLPSHDASGNAIRQTVAHVYDHYSAEGLHMVEHVLLRPRAAGESVLSIPIDETDKIRDPYSHRVSIVLPSGYSRDFSEDPLAAVRNDVAPHRFRDREFRRHAARMIRQACPAHLLPGIYWVDRQAAGTPDDPGSFDQFELRYFAWLDTILIPGVPPIDRKNARAELIEALNAIAGS